MGRRRWQRSCREEDDHREDDDQDGQGGGWGSRHIDQVRGGYPGRIDTTPHHAVSGLFARFCEAKRGNNQ